LLLLLLLVQGRADYHGPSVNLAARMMDAAAHGGLIVTSAELADRIFW
jgi:class 3 adenylate cyclase